MLYVVLAAMLMLPVNVTAQEVIKTPEGLIKTTSLVRRQRFNTSKRLANIVPARDCKYAPLQRYNPLLPSRYVAKSKITARPLYVTSSGTKIYGNVIYRKSWESMGDFEPRPFGIYSFIASDSPALTPVYTHSNIYANGGAYVKDGTFNFINHFSYNGQSSTTFYQYDMSDWSLINQEDGDDSYVAVTLTYNADNDQVYGIFYNDDGTGYNFGYIDYSMGGYRYDLAEDLEVKILALACNQDGEIYGIGIDGKLYTLDGDTGDMEEVGELGVTPSNYLQSAAFDPKTGTLYWASQEPNGLSALYTIDTESGEATKIADFADNEEIVGLYIPSPEAADDAPSAVTDIRTVFDGENTVGTVIFTAPTTTYAGAQLEGELTYTVTINDVAAAHGTVNAGEKATANVEAVGGDNIIAVTTSNKAGKSPVAKINRWIGPDAPIAPANIRLKIDAATRTATLRWNAPDKGQHNGYVNKNDLKYTVVRYPGEVVVAENIDDTVYTQLLPDTVMTAYYYEVAAVNKGIKGASGKSNMEGAGRPLSLPYKEDFTTRNGFTLYHVLDNNNDSASWEYAYGCVRYYGDDNNGADDWLVTPTLHLENDRSYVIAFDFFASDDSKTNKIAVGLGAGSDPLKYTQLLDPTEFNSMDTLAYRDTITVKTAGAYSLAVHVMSEAAQGFITVDNIHIVEGTKFTAPNAATDVVVTPAPLGALKADISFKAPAVTYKGAVLSKIDSICVYRGYEKIKSFGVTAPGTSLHLTDVKAVNGSNTYRIVAYNAEGEGKAAVSAAWIGIDEPQEPQNIKVADNGNDVTISWQAPGNEGIHGGYVVPADLKYNVYDRQGNLLVRNLAAMNYTDRKAVLTGAQNLLYYYVSATSAGGEGYSAASQRIVAGDAYSLPFNENFTEGGLDNKMWWLEGNDKGSFAVTFLQGQGEGRGYALFKAAKKGDKAYLNSGKLSLSGTSNPGLIFYYYAHPGADAQLKVMVSNATSEPQTLLTINHKTLTGDAGWRRAYVDLSSLKDARYIVLSFFATANDVDVELGIDNIQMRDVVAHDLTVGIKAPAVLRLGTENKIDVTVNNLGAMAANGYQLLLKANKQYVDTLMGYELAVGESKTFTMSYTPQVTTGNDVALSAELVYQDDQNTANNKTSVVMVKTRKPQYPVATNVVATKDDANVQLQWQAPLIDTTPVTDDFESYDAWMIDGIGDWSVFDGDKGGTLQYSDIWVPNASKEMAFEVFNNTDEEMETATRRKFLIAHSGVQYLMSFNPSPSYTNKSDDWLISPLLSGKAQTVRFFAKSVAANYPETFEVLYSTTDNNPEHFKSIETFADIKGGITWTEYNIPLPEGTRYFAIHVVTVDGLAFMLDDVTYQAASLVIEGYRIYRDGSFIGSTKDGTTSFVDANVPSGEHVYQVSVVYTVGESLLSHEASVVTAITAVQNTAVKICSVVGGVFVSNAQTKSVSIYTLDGKLIYTGIGSHEQTISLHSGQYLVRVGDTVAKIQVR